MSPMTCEQFEAVLPQLLDDEPAPLTHAGRAHLDDCDECRAMYDDLATIRAQASTLPVLAPSRDLWSGIASRIETPVLPLVDGLEVRRPRRQISLRTASVAAAILVLINGAVTYKFGTRETPATAPEPVMPAPSAMRAAVHQEPMMVPLPVPMAPQQSRRSTIVLATNGDAAIEQGPDQPQQPRRREAAKIVYDREITRLRAIVDSGRHKLDPATVALLDRNLKIIDVAIEQCTEALTRDSSSTFLIESLNNAYQTKVKLLRIAAAAASRE
jgi:hypothetical protein